MRVAILMAGLTAGLPATAQDAGDGAALFAQHCAACHNQGGTGTPGFAPPLNRPAFWAALGPEAPAYLAGVMTAGLAGTIRVEGETYAGLIMPAQALDDAALAAIGDHVLKDLGGQEAGLAPDLVSGTRAAPPSHADLRAMRPDGG